MYSPGISNSLGHSWATRSNLIRGVYAGYVVYTRTGILTAYVSNWLMGTHVSFEVGMVRDNPRFMCRFVNDVFSACGTP